jgi:hypothetical protein
MRRFNEKSARAFSRSLKVLGKANNRMVIASVLVVQSADGGLKSIETEFKYPNQLVREHPNTIAIAYINQKGSLLYEVHHEPQSKKLGFYGDLLIRTSKDSIQVVEFEENV